MSFFMTVGDRRKAQAAVAELARPFYSRLPWSGGFCRVETALFLRIWFGNVPSGAWRSSPTKPFQSFSRGRIIVPYPKFNQILSNQIIDKK